MNKNIAKLKGIRQVNKLPDTKIEEHTQLLLTSGGENQEAIEALKAIGLDSHLNNEMKEASKNKELLLASEKFTQDVFKGQDIQDLCVTYDLKLLPAENYRGPVSLDVGKEIIKFKKQYTKKKKRSESSEEIEVSEINLQHYSFFVLTDDFKKGTSVTLFYRPDSEWGHTRAKVEDVFVEVASFGKPFSDIRRFYSIFDKGENLFSLILFSIITMIFGFGLLFQKDITWLITALGVTLTICLSTNNYNRIKHNWNE